MDNSFSLRLVFLCMIWGIVSLGWTGVTQADLTDDLVGYWPLDDLDAADASGNNLDGEIVGLVESTEDRFGTPDAAMLFAGFAGDYVDLGDDVAFEILGEMTLAAWVMLDGENTNNGRIVSKQGGGGARSWSLNIEGGNSDPTFQIAPDGGTIISVRDLDPLPTDEWVHMVGVYRPGEQTEIYVNAELKAVEDFDIPDEQYSENGLPVLIGTRNACGNCGWLGAIDDVAIWERDLGSDEILALFQNGISGGQEKGDFNRDGNLDDVDLDLLAQGQQDDDPAFDLNGDGTTDLDDRKLWIDELKNSWMGDSNLDGEFNSADLVNIFTAGKYENGEMAGWAEGDWDGNMLFDSADFVVAFAGGGYEQGPRVGANAVPEPTSLVLFLTSLIAIALRRPTKAIDKQ